MSGISMKEIARLAGRSLSTVSRALNDHPSISDPVRRRIQQIAREHGFVPNARGRSLATSRNGTIGIIFPESLDNPDNFSFAGMLLRSIRAILEENELDPLVSFVRNHHSRESNIERLIRQAKVDGLLLIVPTISGEEYQIIRESRIPYVFLHFLPEMVDRGGLNHVYIDHVAGGRLATEHLLRLGCRKILTLTERERQFIERTAGYREAHRNGSLPLYEHLIHSTEATYDAARSAILSHREWLNEIDGVFAQADVMALGVIQAFRELGIPVPEQVPVVGYDDVRMAALTHPALTTIHQPQEELAAVACQHLVDLLTNGNNPEPLAYLLKPRLVVRESAPELKGTSA
ncbi:MAG: LacI family DNA-binding transcriptional regulator [Spirochaetaceae bacterium]